MQISIKPTAIFLFVVIQIIAITISFFNFVFNQEFIFFILGVFILLALNILIYRIILGLFPLKEGIIKSSQEKFNFDIREIFAIFFWNRIAMSYLFPPFLNTTLYRFLGAKIGKDSFATGIILEPHDMVSMGNNCLIGYGAAIIPHIFVTNKIELWKVEISDNVTIGVYSIIYGGVKIGKNSLVVAHSTVVPGTIIGDNEMWGGNPAKFIKKIDPQKDT